MISTLGEKAIQEMDQSKFKGVYEEKEEYNKINKFIINPNNYWKLQWDNGMNLLFIIWIFLAPLFLSQGYLLSDEKFKQLLLFDIIFIIDRFLDLFGGFYQPNGVQEHRLYAVIINNLSYQIFLEIFISIAPYIFQEKHSIVSFVYALYKIPRYSRLFEMDA